MANSARNRPHYPASNSIQEHESRHVELQGRLFSSARRLQLDEVNVVNTLPVEEVHEQHYEDMFNLRIMFVRYPSKHVNNTDKCWTRILITRAHIEQGGSLQSHEKTKNRPYLISRAILGGIAGSLACA